MSLIRARNTLTQYAQPTYLSNGEVSGASTFRVRNINGFNASYAVQAGQTGENTAEIQLLGASAPSGTALTLLNTATYDHPTDTPIYPIKFDKLIFYRSTTGTAGTAVAISSGTIPITPSGTVTAFDDTTAQTTYAYKTAFYNSVTGETSGQSDWITPAGFQFYALGALRQRVKDKLYNASYIPVDIQFDNWINEWMEQMTNAAIKVNQEYSMGSTQVGFSGTTDTGNITATDFKQARKIQMTTDGGVTWYVATKAPLNNLDPNDVYDATQPVFFMYGDNTIIRRPNDTSATASILYYKTNPVLVNDGDTVPLPMQNYSQSFVDYAYAQALKKDNKFTEAQAIEAKAMEMKTEFINEIMPRSQTNQSTADTPAPISGEDGEWLIY